MLKSFLVGGMLITSYTANWMSHPVSLAILVLLSCLNISVLTFKLFNSWLFYLLVLMYLGGVMIIITYMASLAANEKTFVSPHKGFGFTILIFMPMFMYDVSFVGKLNSAATPVSPLYEAAGLLILMLCFLALLLALISIVKLMKLEEGPLVKRLLNPNLKKMYVCQA